MIIKDYPNYDISKDGIITNIKNSNEIDEKEIFHFLINLIESIKETDYEFDNNKILNTALFILFDLKKSGDWGLVNYCKRTGGLLLTMDRLCGLYAVLNSVDVLCSCKLNDQDEIISHLIFFTPSPCAAASLFALSI